MDEQQKQIEEVETTKKDKNYFEVLNSLNVQDKVEKKNGLSYLSWAWAWGELKKRHPDANYTIYENKYGFFYHTDWKTCWVKTGVTVQGVEHIEYLPVMDDNNKSIPADKVTSFDVNKAIQRSLTKAVARHGLGLYIYAGEDLPEEESQDKPKEQKEPAKTSSHVRIDFDENGNQYCAVEYQGKWYLVSKLDEASCLRLKDMDGYQHAIPFLSQRIDEIAAAQGA